uniref:Mos1 transposase HTH domain-containing protein n=1 Tax=Rhodnius prolixus TaxID=13249 RepID=T1HJG0_RHOPR
MSKTRIYEWYKRFQDGRENVEDDERPGRPRTSTTDENVKKVKEMVMRKK